MPFSQAAFRFLFLTDGEGGKRRPKGAPQRVSRQPNL